MQQPLGILTLENMQLLSDTISNCIFFSRKIASISEKDWTIELCQNCQKIDTYYWYFVAILNVEIFLTYVVKYVVLKSSKHPYVICKCSPMKQQKVCTTLADSGYFLDF